jgi:Protein of unknown function (DUF3987)
MTPSVSVANDIAIDSSVVRISIDEIERASIASAHVPFPTAALPSAVRRYVDASADAIGCDTAMIALPKLAGLGRMIGLSRVIELKPGWIEPAILWIALVAASGTHKTPAIKKATEIVRDFDDGNAPNRKNRPCSRFIVNNITMPALFELLADEPDGLLLVQDELAGWLRQIGKSPSGVGTDIGHWLSAWSAEPLRVDRKTGSRPSLNLRRPAISLIGGVQPDTLRRAIGLEHMQDGLCARLLLAMPESRPVRWTDCMVPHSVEREMRSVYEQLLLLRPNVDGEPAAIPLSAGARRIWIEFYNGHHAHIETLDQELRAAGTKSTAYAARFALIVQLCRSVEIGEGCAEIDEDAIRTGIELSSWCFGEARRIYRVLTETEEDRIHRQLIDLIHRRGGQVTARELMRASSHFHTVAAAEKALASLVVAGCGRWDFDNHGGGRGRPVSRFLLTGHEVD